MNIIPQGLIRFSELPQHSTQPSFTTRTNRISAQTQTNTNFSLVTAEGDRVSISTKSASQTTLGTYTFQGFRAGQLVNVQHQEFSASASREFQLHIEGDLNEQEEKDIQRFLQSTKNIFQEFLRGDFSAISDNDSGFEELSTLAAAEASLHHSVSVSSVQQFTQSTPLFGTPGQGSESRGTGPERKPQSFIQTILDRIQKAQEQLQANSAKLINRVPRLLANLIDSLKQDESLNDGQKHALQSLQNELLKPILNRLTPQSTQEKIGGPLENNDQGKSSSQKTIGNSPEIAPIAKPV